MRELYLNGKEFASYDEWMRVSTRLYEEELERRSRRLAQEIIDNKFESVIGAGYYERTGEARIYRDGYYKRYFQFKDKRVELTIPRGRKLKWCFSPFIEKFQRKSVEFEELVREAFLYGMSMRDCRKYFRNIFGEDVISQQTVSNIFRKQTKEVEEWHSRVIEDKYKYIFFDGKYVSIRGSRKIKKVVLKVMGVMFDGRSELIDFRIARSESTINWNTLLQSLYNRGLKCNGTQLFIADGAPGLEETLSLIWPEVERQNCKVHHMRNLLKRVKRINKKQIAKDASKIYKAKSLEEAETRARKFEEKWKTLEEKAIGIFMKNIEPTLTYYKFGWEKNWTKEDRQKLWKVISNTNYLERLIEEDVRRIKPMRCFRNNESCDRILYAIAREYNNSPWWFASMVKYLSGNNKKTGTVEKPIPARILT